MLNLSESFQTSILSTLIRFGEVGTHEIFAVISKDGDIPKAHYKFIFNSNFPNKNKEGNVISNPEREILLDVLFADNHYPTVIERALETEWLLLLRNPDAFFCSHNVVF